MPLAGSSLQVLIVAPVGRDGQLIQDALTDAAIRAETLTTLQEATTRVAKEAIGALLVTEEVMNADRVAELAAELAKQPAWSDLPILVLTIGGTGTVFSRQRERDRLPLGSVTLLERPIRMATLVSGVRSALRSRNRQYEVRDILLERDLAVVSLQNSESRLRLALETARLGAWELDLASGVVLASKECCKAFDLPLGQRLQRADFLGRIHIEDRPEVDRKLQTAVAEGGEYRAEYRVVWRDDNVRWISASGRVQQDGRTGETSGASTRRLVGVTLDITERVLSETALRNADKLALVGRLASSIAHEINNPLESVTNLLYLLGLAKLGSTEHGYVVAAQQELARVSEITAQTLAFNRQRNAHELAVVAEILDSVLALYQGRLLTSNIAVARRYRTREPIVSYPGELRQVFSNLIGNAFDAMRTGGRILVRVRPALHPVTGVPGQRITVADTGAGMPSQVQSRLFEAFHSTKGNNGTGLGLWISKGIVEKHGGSLRFSSSVDVRHAGTVFSIFLPS